MTAEHQDEAEKDPQTPFPDPDAPVASEIVAELATAAHPASAQQWRLTDAAINQLCDELPGKPVTVNYSGQPVGTVVRAQRGDGGVKITITVADPTIRQWIEADKYAVGPALANPDAPPQWPAGEYLMDPAWHVQQVGIVPREPREEPPIVGKAQ